MVLTLDKMTDLLTFPSNLQQPSSSVSKQPVQAGPQNICAVSLIQMASGLPQPNLVPRQLRCHLYHASLSSAALFTLRIRILLSQSSLWITNTDARITAIPPTFAAVICSDRSTALNSIPTTGLI